MNAMKVTHCRGCGQTLGLRVFSLGEQYLSDFSHDPHYRPPKAPLDLMQCDGCGLVQLGHTVARSLMYHDRYGYRSGVNQGIRDNLEQIVQQVLQINSLPESWLDIASNDGTLLSFVPKGTIRVGVDPVKAFQAEALGHANRIIADYFTRHLFSRTQGVYEQFDVVTSISMFYDLHNPDQFVADVRKVLAPQGVWIVQQNYLHDMYDGLAFDNICHEHLTYFDLRSLESILHRHDLQVVHVDRTPINGGCFRTVIAHKGAVLPDDTVQHLRDWEANRRLLWAAFGDAVESRLARIRGIVTRHSDRGEPVYLYGASTRGAVIWQALNCHRSRYTAAVEVQPGKIGRYYSAVGGVLIVSEEQMRANPGLTLVGPYWHRDMFIQRESQYIKDGGKLLFPLPDVEVHTR